MAEWSSPETADLVLAHLREQAGHTTEVVASSRELGSALHISRGSARNALRRLLDTGALQLVRLGTGHRYPSRYRLADTAPPNATPADNELLETTTAA